MLTACELQRHKWRVSLLWASHPGNRRRPLWDHVGCILWHDITGLRARTTSCLFGCGTVFKLSVGLGPFVRTLPTSGKVGAAVKVLGTDLTGATSVTFEGAPAGFTTCPITTTVLAGTTSGKVQVTTPGGTLVSDVAFDVRP